MTSSSYTASAIRGSDRGYTAYHAPRYAFLLDLLQQLDVGARTRVLDIGRSHLTELIAQRFGCRPDSLGFDLDGSTPQGRHYHFDLNQTQREDGWRRDVPTYDVIVMAEVIEHLYTAPQLVLAYLRTLIQPGGRLIVQTPNAASIQKRIKMMLGRNPYEMIRTDNTNPGHFREYTIRELRNLSQAAGFDVEQVHTAFYFDARYSRHGAGGNLPQPVLGTVKNTIYRALPSGLREGVTMVLRRR